MKVVRIILNEFDKLEFKLVTKITDFTVIEGLSDVERFVRAENSALIDSLDI